MTDFNEVQSNWPIKPENSIDNGDIIPSSDRRAATVPKITFTLANLDLSAKNGRLKITIKKGTNITLTPKRL